MILTNLYDGNSSEVALEPSSPIVPQTVTLSIRSDIKDKSPKGQKREFSFAEPWNRSTLTLDQIKEHIGNGKPIIVSELQGFYNKNEYFKSAQIVGIDVDNSQGKKSEGTYRYKEDLTIAQALELPFVQNYCAMAYTSPSHKEGWDRFRLFFVLPEVITDPKLYKRLIVAVCSEIPGADHTTSITQIFFGNTKAEFPLFNPLAVLPYEYITTAKQSLATEQSKPAKQPKTLQSATALRDFAEGKNLELTPLAPLALQLSGINPLKVISEKSLALFYGILDEVDGDRSEGLAQVYKELLGWENLGVISAQAVTAIIRDMHTQLYTAEERQADQDRLDRIVASVDSPYSRVPGIYYANLDKGNHQAYVACLRKAVQAQLSSDTQQKQAPKFQDHPLFKQWVERKRYTADLISNTIEVNGKLRLDPDQFVEVYNSGEFNIITLKAAMSLGKTEALCRLLASNPELGVLMIGYRNALLVNTVQRLSKYGSFYHLINDSAKHYLADKHSRIALCIDSLWKLQDSDADGKIIILDEALSIMFHALLSFTVAKQNRKKILDKFETLIKRCKAVILLDGNLNDDVVNWIKRVRDDARVCSLENPTPAPRLKVEWINAIKPNDPDTVCLNDKSPILRLMLDTLDGFRLAPAGQAKAISVIADSQRLLEAYDRILTKAGYRVLRLDSKTAQDHQDIIKNIDEFLKDNHIDALLLSPTCESGVDVSIQNYFTKCFALFHGVIGTDSQKQFIRRIRNCQDWAIWCAERANMAKQHMLSRDIKSVINNIAEGLATGIDMAIKGTEIENIASQLEEQALRNITDTNFQQAVKELMFLNFERAYSKDALRYSLEGEADFTDVYEFRSDLLNDTVKTEVDEILLERGKRIYNADVITIDQAREIKKSSTGTIEDTAKADRALLLDRLPGLENSPLWKDENEASIWIASYYWKSKRQDVRFLERSWFVANLEVAKLLSVKDVLSVATTLNSHESSYDDASVYGSKKISFRSFYGHDVRFDFGELKTIVDLGLLDLLGGKQYSNESPEIQKISTKIKRSTKIQKILGKTPGKDPIGFIADLLRSIGCKVHTKRIKSDPRLYSFYSPLDQSFELDAQNKAQELVDKSGSDNAFEKLSAANKKLEKSNFDLLLLECIDRRMTERAESIELPKPEEFETRPIHVEGVPHYLEWCDTVTQKDIEELWELADTEEAKEYVRVMIKGLWEDFKKWNKGMLDFLGRT